MLQGILYKIGDDVVVRLDDVEHVTMKARLSQFIYVWYRGEMHVFFGASYYYMYQVLAANGQRKQRLTRIRKGADFVEPIMQMHLIYTDQMAPFDDKCFRPLSFLQHKFMSIGPIHDGFRREGLRIAYEMCDSRQRQRVLELHSRVLEQ